MIQQVGLLRRGQWALAAKPVGRGVKHNKSLFVAMFWRTQYDFRRVGVGGNAQGGVIAFQQLDKLSQGGAHQNVLVGYARAKMTREVGLKRQFATWQVKPLAVRIHRHEIHHQRVIVQFGRWFGFRPMIRFPAFIKALQRGGELLAAFL